MNNLFGHLNHECFKLSKPVGSLHESFDFPRVLHIAKLFKWHPIIFINFLHFSHFIDIQTKRLKKPPSFAIQPPNIVQV